MVERAPIRLHYYHRFIKAGLSPIVYKPEKSIIWAAIIIHSQFNTYFLSNQLVNVLSLKVFQSTMSLTIIGYPRPDRNISLENWAQTYSKLYDQTLSHSYIYKNGHGVTLMTLGLSHLLSDLFKQKLGTGQL